MSGNFGRKGQNAEELDRMRAAFVASERARSDVKHWGSGSAAVRLGGADYSRSRKSLAMAYLLWFLCYALSAHRFYLGAYRSAFVQSGLFVLGIAIIVIGAANEGAQMAGAGFSLMAISGAWMLADAFLIPGLLRRNKDRYGTNAAFA